MRTARFLLLLLPAIGPLARAEWLPLGPEGGPIQALGLDPHQTGRLLAAACDLKRTQRSRVFASDDRAGHWRVIGQIPSYSVNSILVDPHDPRLVYATGRTDRVFRSTDRGETWSNLYAGSAGGAAYRYSFATGLQEERPKAAIIRSSPVGRVRLAWPPALGSPRLVRLFAKSGRLCALLRPAPELDLSRLASGIYCVELVGSRKRMRMMLVLLR